MTVRLGVVVLATSAMLFAAGCQSTVDGSPATPTTVADKDLFDPCTQIPKDALVATGVDPNKQLQDIGGAKQPGWKICGWKSNDDWYYLNVYSSSHSIDEIRHKPGTSDVKDISVGDRRAIQYRDTEYHPEQQCFVSFAAAQGLIEVNVEANGGEDVRGNTCDLAQKHASDLSNYLPK